MKKASDAAVWLAHDGRLAEVDPVTLMVDQVAYPAKTELPPLKNPLPRWAEAWRARKGEPVVAAVDVRSWLKGNGLASLDARQWLPVGELSFQTFYPLMLYVDWAVAGVDMKEKIAVSVVVQSDDKQKAERVRDTLQALLVMTRNMTGVYDMAQVPEGTPGATQITLYKKVSEIAGNLLDSAKLTVDDSRVNVSLQTKQSTQEIAQLVKMMLPSVEEARQAARQQQSTNNMKQLALAMMMYESDHKAFPPAASYTYKNGKSKHPHSWRIDVLPYLEQNALYNQYHFDEPWDSEANTKVLAKIPDVFRSPHQSDPLNTSYFALAGPRTVFDGETGTKLKQITDGTSRTILLVEAKRPVPWTKPEDIPYAADKPLPKLGAWAPGEFLLAIADGSVRRVAANVDEKLLRAWITRAGGENVPNLPVPRGGQ